jgi:hypothetical protein
VLRNGTDITLYRIVNLLLKLVKNLDSVLEKDKLFYLYFVKYDYAPYQNVIQVKVQFISQYYNQPV